LTPKSRLLKTLRKSKKPIAPLPKFDLTSSSSSSDESSSSFMSTNQAEDTAKPTFNPPTINVRNKAAVSPSKTGKITGIKIDEIIFEVFQCNDEKFDGVLTRADAKELWKALGRSLEEVKRVSRERVKNKCFRICYYLRAPIAITEISRKSEFEIEKTGSFKSDCYTIRLPSYYKLACQVGDTVTVSLKTSIIGIPERIVKKWLKHFGDLTSSLRYTNNIHCSYQLVFPKSGPVSDPL